MSMTTIAGDMLRLAAMDRDIDLFEGQYPVPDGVSYNSYLILDEKTALLDTVDTRCQSLWLPELEAALAGRALDYLVVSHVEPDHAGSLAAVCARYPQLTLIGSSKALAMIDQFFPGVHLGVNRRAVCEDEVLNLGRRRLRFIAAPMVHWPEVMVAYEETERILFSADAFGRFGDLDPAAPWEAEARRYYTNIVGKYGGPVQTLLRKALRLDIDAVCPLHGPMLRGDALGEALRLYGLWSTSIAQERGVLVAYAGFHGNTARAAEDLARFLREMGAPVIVMDLARVHPSYALSAAFRMDRLALLSATYDGACAPAMSQFLALLRAKNLQNRTVALVENGAWAPLAAKVMTESLCGLKNITLIGEPVTIRAAATPDDQAALLDLARRLWRCSC